MAFTNVPPDLTLPPGNGLGAGTGTVYIGAANLPPGLNTGAYKSAFIWYTDAVGQALGIDYWFLAYTSDAVPEAGVRFGYYPTGGPATVPLMAGFDINGTQVMFVEAPDQVQLKTSKTSGNIFIGSATQLSNSVSLISGGEIVLNAAAPVSGDYILFELTTASVNEQIAIRGLGTLPQIKAHSASVDVWLQATTTNTLGAVTLTTHWEWRRTVDGIVDLRADTVATGGTVGNAAFAITVPAGVPSMNATDPFTQGLRGITRVAGGTNGFAPNLLVPTQLTVDNSDTRSNGVAATEFWSQFMYTADKA